MFFIHRPAPPLASSVEETGLSRRRFAQLFREQVGITPKLFCRLHRFQRVLRHVASGVPVDWAEVAVALQGLRHFHR